jgi:succinate dehydrogenase hydrophobic anchor subunit
MKSNKDRWEETMTAKIKVGRNHQRVSGNPRPGILNGWILPIIISGVLLVLAIFLVNLNIQGAFTQYANCHYVVVTQLKMDPFFCNGYDVKVFDATIFSIPGMKSVMDPTLERIRLAVAWGVLLLFACISLFLTIIVVNIKTVIGLLTFNKEEWKKFLAGTRVWLFLFVGICAIFYLAVVK